MSRKLFQVAFLALLAATVPCAAQTAQIVGRVTDASGAVVPGISIKITNVGTGNARDVQTNADGYYAVPLLQPGEYSAAVEQKGFKSVNRSGIVLEVDQRAELNFTLEVGAVSEKIVVTADARS